jgi:fumarate hydratase class II
MKTKRHRMERDSMGEMKVPRQAYWGPETQRAYENFPISGLHFPREFIKALGVIKIASAETNMKLRLLSPKLGRAILRAAREVMEGKLDDHFVLDIFQTGSGTSTNMNANEVIAHRANQILGGKVGEKKPVHPNDHVNLGQSSNDVIPSAIHIAALEGVHRNLIPALETLQVALEKKAQEFDGIIKIGRTHLQDATPIRLGQEFSGYAQMVKYGVQRLEIARYHLAELAMGGTAVGTGINTHPSFAGLAIKKINGITGLAFREAENHFEAQGAKDAVVEASGVLKAVAVSLTKVANDIRWLASGPRCGIGEIILPAVQPGSSIMPGKVNPVIPEALIQVAAQVMGNDLVVALAGMGGYFELNLMMPVMAHNLLQSIQLLTKASSIFTRKCILGLKADKARCEEMVEKSLAMVTALSPHIGHDRAAEIAREAYKTGKTVREIAVQKHVLPAKKLEKILDPWKMTEPGL